MGGVVPLGYRIEDRALHIVDDHAAIMRSLFRRYLEAGSVVCLKQSLDAEGLRIPIRIDGAGRSTGGGLFSRGHIYKLLSNPIYVGRIAHKGQVHDGVVVLHLNAQLAFDGPIRRPDLRIHGRIAGPTIGLKAPAPLLDRQRRPAVGEIEHSRRRLDHANLERGGVLDENPAPAEAAGELGEERVKPATVEAKLYVVAYVDDPLGKRVVVQRDAGRFDVPNVGQGRAVPIDQPSAERAADVAPDHDALGAAFGQAGLSHGWVNEPARLLGLQKPPDGGGRHFLGVAELFGENRREAFRARQVSAKFFSSHS